ncbi:DedA family protein [Streptosporangium lutulentum]|uniref:Membrane-associated protein n=1 Tax=Streptosporangium lutulentum TaxID=1461250 RepID=A0ABT9QG83_9ACTN|nr:VTT domain-containing protein [Streptosporangium lutulentum]MDP9845785.1 membrane-associated protein [Streptosporangium lutulentum]
MSVVDTLAAQSLAVVALTTFLFMVTETSLFVGLLVPGDVAVLVSGTTAGSVAEYAALVAAAASGAMLGETIGYLLGRRFGSRIRSSRLGTRLGEDRWAHAERLASGQNTGWALVTGRFVPLLHSIVPIVSGTLRMPYLRFITWEAAACAVWAATYVAIGSLVGGAFHDHGGRIGYAVSAALVLVILTVATVGRKVRAR